ncbi:MAG: ABC transporter permease [Ilumatobacter sp.]|uniref:ABC transporter permease n=1 Tax=Ilumatobacter sp. TaxID=1967498 RepID=UPI003919C383
MTLALASVQRTRIELLRFGRTREHVLFSFALPVVLMTLLASILGGEIGSTGVDFSQYIVAGMIATVALNVGVNDLAPQLALDRADGTVKRLGGTPMPPAAYVLGKLGSVVVTAILQTAILLAIGVALFGVELPSADRWVTFSWVFVLGLTSAVLLGMAISTVATDPRSASAVVTLPFIALQFISGIWFQFSDLPSGLQQFASLFPLRWMALGMRSVFLPDSFAANEPGGSWQLGMVALVLALWTAVGLALVLGRFRLRTER